MDVLLNEPINPYLVLSTPSKDVRVLEFSNYNDLINRIPDFLELASSINEKIHNEEANPTFNMGEFVVDNLGNLIEIDRLLRLLYGWKPALYDHSREVLELTEKYNFIRQAAFAQGDRFNLQARLGICLVDMGSSMLIEFGYHGSNPVEIAEYYRLKGYFDELLKFAGNNELGQVFPDKFEYGLLPIGVGNIKSYDTWVREYLRRLMAYYQDGDSLGASYALYLIEFVSKVNANSMRKYEVASRTKSAKGPANEMPQKYSLYDSARSLLGIRTISPVQYDQEELVKDLRNSMMLNYGFLGIQFANNVLSAMHEHCRCSFNPYYPKI